MNNMPSFHEGELDVQRRAHEDEIATHRIGLIKHVIVGGAVPFIRQQSMAVAGSIDASGRVWASMIFGEPGFLDPSDDAQSLAIHLDRTVQQPNDPLLPNLELQPQIGLMLIELSSRRRLRVNGIAEKTGDTLSVTVRESFPLCPKYIQRRQIQLLSGNDQPRLMVMLSARSRSPRSQPPIPSSSQRLIACGGRMYRTAAEDPASSKSSMQRPFEFRISPATRCSIRWGICL